MVTQISTLLRSKKLWKRKCLHIIIITTTINSDVTEKKQRFTVEISSCNLCSMLVVSSVAVLACGTHFLFPAFLAATMFKNVNAKSTVFLYKNTCKIATRLIHVFLHENTTKIATWSIHVFFTRVLVQCPIY